MKMPRSEIWHLARAWVKSHPVLILCIASPYLRYTGWDEADLESEALLIAYQVLSHMLEHDRALIGMDKYFRVVFQSRCMAASEIRLMNYDLDPEQLPATPTGPEHDDDPSREAIESILQQALTSRQRQVATWILSQPRPVSIGSVARAFGIQIRSARAIIHNAVARLEIHGGHRRVCEELSAAA